MSNFEDLLQARLSELRNPTTDLETRIAEVVAQALELDDDDEGVWFIKSASDHPAIIAAALAPVIAEAQAEAWDAGYTVGNAHNGCRDANPYRADKLDTL